jgi:hypothetical protein
LEGRSRHGAVESRRDLPSNAEENGGWNPVDLWQLDDAFCVDVLLVLRLIAQEHKYPDDLGFGPEITKVWKRWRQPAT